MSQKTVKRIHLCYGIAVSVLVVVLGALLIHACLDIYQSGTRPFSRETVVAHFDEIAIFVYITALAILGGILLSILLPTGGEKPKAIREESVMLRRISARLGKLAEKDPICRKEARLRIVLRTVAILIVIASAIYPTLYLFDASHFTIANLNADVVKAVSYVLAATAVSILVCTVCTYLSAASRTREIARLKQLQKEQILVEKNSASGSLAPQEGQVVCASAEKHQKALVIVLRCVLLGVGILLCVLGILNDGIRDVLLKATQICTECVGIG